MTNKSSFNMQEKVILKIAFEEQIPMSIKEIAERAQMGWTTTKKYVERLIGRGWLLQKEGKIKFHYSRLTIEKMGHRLSPFPASFPFP